MTATGGWDGPARVAGGLTATSGHPGVRGAASTAAGLKRRSRMPVQPTTRAPLTADTP